LKDPELLLNAICTPSTLIGCPDAARPSMRSLVPLTSARVTVTAAWATSARVADTTAIVSRLATPAKSAVTRIRRLGMVSPDFAVPDSSIFVNCD